MAAKKKPIEETTLAALGVAARSASKIVDARGAAGAQGRLKVQSVEELVQKLHNEAKVI